MADHPQYQNGSPVLLGDRIRYMFQHAVIGTVKEIRIVPDQELAWIHTAEHFSLVLDETMIEKVSKESDCLE